MASICFGEGDGVRVCEVEDEVEGEDEKGKDDE